MKKLGQKGLKWLKGLHLVAVSCWLGTGAALVLLYFLKGNGGQSELFTKHISHLDILTIYLPGAIGCLLTGAIYSIFSHWGFFRHKWITLKWIVTIALIATGALYLGPWRVYLIEISEFIGFQAIAAALYQKKTIAIFSAIQALVLIITVFIAALKPWDKKEVSVKQEFGAKDKAQTFFQQKWLVTIAVGTGVFLATLDGSIVNVSLPTMVASLKTNFTIIQWVVLAYLLTVTTLMLGFGRLGDILGKKRIYLLGFTIFTISSALCGFTPSVYFLIGARIIQATGAAMIMALGAAIMTESFPPEERGMAMGIIGSVVSIGIVTGPTLGGMIINYLSWHWIFFVNIPTGIAGVWMVWRFVPNLSPLGRQKFDTYGAIILFVALICFLMGLSFGQQYGFSNLRVVILLPVALIFTLIFIVFELRVNHPMIDLRLFKNTLLCVNLFTGFTSFLAIGGTFILIPFYLEVILGYQTIKVGLLMSVVPIMMGLFSPAAGLLSDRVGSRPITLMGLAALFLGYLASGTLDGQTDALGYMLRMSGIGIGMGLFLSPNNSAIMGSGPKSQLGIVSGLMAISRTLGQTVGVSVIGTLWAVRVRTIADNWKLSDVTKAPLDAQIQGLQFIFFVVAALVLISFLISVFGYRLTKKQSARAGRL